VGAVMVGDPQDVKPDVLNDYFMYAKGDETKATQIYILLKYFLLQLYPYPLASDYSFKSIAFRHFSSPEVIISVVLHLTIIGGVIYAILKKHLILTFAGMYYIFNLMLINNLIFNIGASMGERLVYNSSLGLIIAIFYAFYYFTKGLSGKSSIYVGGALVAIIAIPSFAVVSGRCAAWKNDYTLATTDVKTNPNSALLNANAGTYTVNKSELFINKPREKEMVMEARGYIKKALEVHPLMANGWMNLSVIEHKLNNFEASELAVKKVIEIFPSHPKVPVLLNMVSNDYINVGFEKYKEGNVDSCFIYLYRAKNVAPNNPEAYYNLGGAYLSVARNLDSAEFYFTKTVQMNPQHQQANQGLASVKQARGQ
jgi:tetratricopeptide (TPR) repeat protein